MTNQTASRTLAELVTERGARARVFERYHLDYCCGGSQSLADACAHAGCDVDDVVTRLDTLDAPDDRTNAIDAASGATLAELAATIVATHHHYLDEELPLLDALATKVVAAHGARHPELEEVRALVAALRADLEPHMRKEELVLFPAIDRLEQGERSFPFGSIANPVRMMRVEHERAGELLARLHAVTGAYEVPADACGSYRSLYERLAELELDTHLHIHVENNVLFPRAVALFDASEP